MKSTVLAVAAAMLSLVFDTFAAAPLSAQTAPAGTPQDARMSLFYNALTPYGEWVYNDRYGWCWYPDNISVDWRPYTEGSWLYTDAGWTFNSTAPYGWATFHYGRWFYDDDQGWLWYPDTEWAPAWVAWRYNKNHVGWAPLTPDCIWSDAGGLTMGSYDPDTIPLNYYTFCRTRDFASPDVQSHYLMIAKNATYVQKTQFISGTLSFSNASMRNELPFHNVLVQAAGHDFARIPVSSAGSIQDHGYTGNTYRIFRPELAVQNGRIPLFRGEQPQVLQTRQTQESDALAVFQQNQRDSLERDHLTERQAPPDGTVPAQLDSLHKKELQAQQEQQGREQRLVQNQHQYQMHNATAPQAPQQKQHYLIPPAGQSPKIPKEKDPKQQDPKQLLPNG